MRVGLQMNHTYDISYKHFQFRLTLVNISEPRRLNMVIMRVGNQSENILLYRLLFLTLRHKKIKALCRPDKVAP